MIESRNPTWLTRKRARYAFLSLVLLVVLYGMYPNRPAWTKITDTFMRLPEYSYGTGSFIIFNERLMALKLTQPKITFKPQTAEELADWDTPLEVTEPWMDNTAELLNRSAIIFLKGRAAGRAQKTFEEQAQFGNWWVSPDQQVVYISTVWHDYHRLYETASNYHLVKSEDYGETFTRLDWPVTFENTTFMRFRNAHEGYILSEGSWIHRTVDGGKSWQNLGRPEAAINPDDPRTYFDAATVNADSNRLYFSFSDYHQDEKYQSGSQIWSLAGTDDKARFLSRLPGRRVIDLQTTHSDMYLLAVKLEPKDYYDSGKVMLGFLHSPKELWRLSLAGGEPALLKTFTPDTDAGALYILPSGTLVVDTVIGQDDVLFLSRNQGRSWREENEGKGGGGVYFNPLTGERYRAKGYTLYRRILE